MALATLSAALLPLMAAVAYAPSPSTPGADSGTPTDRVLEAARPRTAVPGLPDAAPPSLEPAADDANPNEAEDADGDASEDDDLAADTRPLVAPPPDETAPPPGQAQATTKPPPYKRQGWKWIPRTILFVPRWAVELGTYPIYLGLLAYRKYAVRERVVDVFFNDERTFGIFPTVFAETGFGANIGLRLIHRDLFGHGEGLRLRAGWGGIWRQVYEGRISTGDLLSQDVSLAFFGGFEILPRLRFFGLGNDDEVEIDAFEADTFEPIDPNGPGGAIDTRYRADIGTWGGLMRLQLHDDVVAEIGHRWRWARFGDPIGNYGDLVKLDEVYDVNSLPGWGGLLNNYSELSLRYDDTETVHPWLSKALPSRGWRARLYGGVAEAPHDPTQYFTSGFELQRYFNLYRGDRVLNVRLAADAIHGPRHRIPFIAYPALGGPDYLRGYTRDRFRDRFATLASVEYTYPINQGLAGYLFVDTGRVWSRPYVMELDGFAELRAGFGGGFKVLMGDAFIARVQAATSMDGGFFMQFRLNQAQEIRGTF